MWRTECNKNKSCIQRICNKLQSRVTWEKRSDYAVRSKKIKYQDLFSDLLNETKGFKYQITLKVTLKQYKPNGGLDVTPVYFNSTTKTVINHKFSLENAFKKFYTGLITGLMKDLTGLLN